MKTPDDYASELGTRTSTFAECRDLFAACQREAIEACIARLRAEAKEWRYGAADKATAEHAEDALTEAESSVRALLTPATPPRQDGGR